MKDFPDNWLIEMEEVTGDSTWICPNDRHLALRAKLRSGWSVRSNQISRKDVPTLFPEELEKIKNVMNKASMLEEMEQERIGSLVHRLNIMRQNSKGNGNTACILCAEPFGKIIGNAPILCTDCKKKVCTKCCVDYGTGMRPAKGKQNTQNPAALWLCKLCSENRELWKRSGAWFFQMLPAFKLPNPEQTRDRFTRRPVVQEVGTNKPDSLTLPGSPAVNSKGHNRSLSSGSTGSYRWAKPTKTYDTSSSSSELEESSDDDGITLGKTSKQNTKLKSDNVSMTSSTSAMSSGPHSLSTGNASPVVSRQNSGRKTFRNRPQNPKLMVTDDGDSTSIDSRVTETSFEDSKHVTDMSTLHGRGDSNRNLYSEDVMTVITNKEGRGNLEFSVLYDPLKCALHVNIVKAENLIAMDANGLSDPYVKLHLLPGITRATKLRTKTKGKTLNPVFKETLTYWGILEQELVARKLLLTVLDEDRFGQDFIGEVAIPLKGIIASETKHYNMALNAAYALTEDHKLPGDPGRIFLGLRYHSQDHCLSVKIHRCTSLFLKKDHEINASVKATFAFDENRSISHKTEIKRKSHNPVFDRELKFRVSADNGQAELARGSLLVTVMHKDALGQEALGSVKFAINSSGEQLKHWFDCLKHADQQFDRWHVLSHENPRKSKSKS